MSQENVELVYQGFDAWNRRDLDAALAGAHADVEATPVMGPASTTYRGHEGMRRFWDDIISTFPDFSTEVVEARDLGDFVVGRVRISGQGTGSEVPSEQTVWYATEWRGGKLLWYCAYDTEREALEAMGLRELAMSQENVEIVREAWVAWLRGDLDTLFANYFDRDAIYDLTHFREWPDNTYRGIDGVRRGLTEWLAVWEAWEARVDGVLAAPDGRVVVLTWQRGKGRQSGLPMEMEWAQVITVRDGRITRVYAYDERLEALEAAGLRE